MLGKRKGVWRIILDVMKEHASSKQADFKVNEIRH